MNRDTIRKAIDDLYTIRLANEPAGCLTSFTDDATFALAGTNDIAGLSPPIRGKKALEPFLSQLVSTWRWHAHEPIAVLIDGQSAAVRYRLTATHVPSGKSVVTEIMDHIVFDEQAKIREMVQFVDTAAIGSLSKP